MKGFGLVEEELDRWEVVEIRGVGLACRVLVGRCGQTKEPKVALAQEVREKDGRWLAREQNETS